MTEALAPTSTADEIVSHLRTLGSEANREGMKRYGIKVDRALGISHGLQRNIAKTIRRDHRRAIKLWASGIVEAQFIASLTADPKLFSAEDARNWASDFDSWDIVDGVSDLFANTDHWKELITEFAADEREFVRRSAFAMIAWSSVHRKKEPDETFLDFLRLIEMHANDPRNFVKKAVNWALRSIGKRSLALNTEAIRTAERLAASDDSTARWNGKDSLRELSDPARIEKLRDKASKSGRQSPDLIRR